jgi:pimeloyl-ACP methyl ester carboxylesterase
VSGRLRCLFARVVALSVAGFTCRASPEHRDTTSSPAASSRGESAAAAPERSRDSGPVRVEALDPAAAPATFVVRGAGLGPGRLVFLHGMCGHALGYAQSFQVAAAKRGRLVAPQADVVCGEGPWAKWSRDVKALHERIERAFVELGDSPPIDDICVIGYSQGATRAEALAREFPDSYSRLISIGAPGVANPYGLTHLRAALMMAGARDRLDLMKEGAKRLARAKVRAEFRIIPEATHGSMGPHPEQTMQEALDWVYAEPEAAAHQQSP